MIAEALLKPFSPDCVTGDLQNHSKNADRGDQLIFPFNIVFIYHHAFKR